MGEIKSIIGLKAVVEYKLYCEESKICKTHLEGSSCEDLEQSIEHWGWKLIDGKIYCEDCVKNQ
jgi:hypothetical protein